MWESIHAHVGCQILQNNFEHPPFPALGNLDATVAGGQTRFVYELNRAFARAAAADRRVLIHDLNGAGRARRSGALVRLGPLVQLQDADHARGRLGDRQFDRQPRRRRARARAQSARARPRQHPVGRRHRRRRRRQDRRSARRPRSARPTRRSSSTCLGLRERGVAARGLLEERRRDRAHRLRAIPTRCSSSSTSSAFRANWEPKPDNIRAIAEELNLGLDSFVFVDDNPAERAIVRGAAADGRGARGRRRRRAVSRRSSHAGRYFETVGAVAGGPRARRRLQRQRRARARCRRSSPTTASTSTRLQMTAEIGPFKPVYLRAHHAAHQQDEPVQPDDAPLHARRDRGDRRRPTRYVDALRHGSPTRFGDNGLISVIIGRRRRRHRAHRSVDHELPRARSATWSSRCSTRSSRARAPRASTELRGTYLRTPKNAMVAEHYETLGFHAGLAGERRQPLGVDARRRELRAAQSPHKGQLDEHETRSSPSCTPIFRDVLDLPDLALTPRVERAQRRGLGLAGARQPRRRHREAATRSSSRSASCRS